MTEQEKQWEVEDEASNTERKRWMTQELPKMPEPRRTLFIRGFLTEAIPWGIADEYDIIFREPYLLCLTWEDLPPFEIKIIQKLRKERCVGDYKAKVIAKFNEKCRIFLESTGFQ